MKGLSLKKADMRELCIDESGFYIENEFHTNGRTAQVERKYLVKKLAELHDEMPFDTIKIKGHYETTGEELMAEVLKLNAD